MSNPQIAQELPPSQVMMQLLTGKWIAQAVSVVATLGIADLLAGGPQSVEQLARASSSHADSLYRVLRALASTGIFAETEDRRFTLTPLAQCLCSDVPDSVRNPARMFGLPLFWQSWGELLHSVKTGETGLKRAFGLTEPFGYLSQHPEDAKIFDAAMNDVSRITGPSIAEAYDFGRFNKIIDAGGGHGMLIMCILRRYPRLHGVVFDLPHVIKGTEAAIEAAGLADRCETIAGDLFESVPSGGDGYVMRSIIHELDSERALVILRNVRRAIPPTGRLLLAEFVVPAGNKPSLGKLSDLQMLVMVGGRERTEAEFRDLLSAAGFELRGIHAQSVIEGVPV